METKYKTKVVELNDKQRDFQKILAEREYNREILVACEKQRIVLSNDISKMGKSKYNVDFSEMTKAQIIKFCLMLSSNIDDLEKNKAELEAYALKMENQYKMKFSDLLKSVRQCEKKAEERSIEIKPSKIKRMTSTVS